MTPKEKAVLDAALAWYDVTERIEPAEPSWKRHQVKNKLADAVRAWQTEARLATEKPTKVT